MSDAVMVPRAFEEWLYGLEGYGLRVERLSEEMRDPVDKLLPWLLAAFDVGRLAASPSVGGWEDISTAPRDLVVQMYEPHSQGGFMFAGCVGVDGSCRDNLRGDALNPTHWMPLPPPPSVSTGSRPQAEKGS